MATILVIDTRDLNREYLVTLLGYQNHVLLEAVEGASGLALARAKRPDLIITDRIMPGMDGYELARQVREDPLLKNTPIIFYTASSMVEETRQWAEAGGLSYILAKPAEPKSIIETIEAALSLQPLSPSSPIPDNFDREQLHLLSETLAKKVEELEQEIAARKQRERELEAIATLSAALRSVAHRNEILPIILEKLLDFFEADGTALLTPIPNSQEITVELARGKLSPWQDVRFLSTDSISGEVLSTGRIYLNNEVRSDPRAKLAQAVPELHAAAYVPLIAQGKNLGVLWIGRKTPLLPEDTRVLNAIADFTSNALQRASFYAQTQKQLERFIALRSIDIAISGSLDMRFTLKVLLDQVIQQLHIDAADVLLLNPQKYSLEYAAGRGFRFRTIEYTDLRLGRGYAGKVALERRTLGLPDLTKVPEELSYVNLSPEEGFKAYYGVPLIMKGAVQGVLEIFHRSPLSPDDDWEDFLQVLAGQTAIAIENAQLFTNLQTSNLQLTLAYDATIEGWSRALDLRDNEAEGHTQRVAELTLTLANASGQFAETELVHIRRGALLHDIGKMGIPDAILLKPGPLTPEEWEIMKKHPTYAYELLAPISYLRPALDIPYCHHEKWDGTGYPRGLKAEQIPLAARLFAVVDVWDALTSDRSYRAAWPPDKALAYIREQAGSHFDPQAAELFFRLAAPA